MLVCPCIATLSNRTVSTMCDLTTYFLGISYAQINLLFEVLVLSCFISSPEGEGGVLPPDEGLYGKTFF